MTYTVTVTNTGPSSATGIILTDRLPAVMSFRSATLSQGSCSLMSDVVTCNLGTIDVGANAAVVITVTPLSAESGFSVTNTASVEAVEPDSDRTNNTASQSTMVARKADLSVMQKDTPDPVLEGESLTYTVTVTNNGPSQATGVVLTDTLPAAVTFVSVIPTQGNCTHESRVVSCLFKALDSGASTEVTIAVKLPKGTGGTTITHTTDVRANEADPDNTNNGTTGSTVVTPISPPGPTPTPFPPLTVIPDDEITPPMAETSCSVNVVHPTQQATFELPERGVKLHIPAPVHQRTFQVRLCPQNPLL